MPHGYDRWPFSSPPHEDPPPRFVTPEPMPGWSVQVAQQVAAVAAQLQHVVGWMERLSDMYESDRVETVRFRSKTLQRLTRLESQATTVKPAPPSWSERLKAAKEVATALIPLAAITLGAAKALNWVSPETAERLLAFVQRAPAP